MEGIGAWGQAPSLPARRLAASVCDYAQLACEQDAYALRGLSACGTVVLKLAGLKLKRCLDLRKQVSRIDAHPASRQPDRVRPVEGELPGILDSSFMRQAIAKLVIETLMEVARKTLKPASNKEPEVCADPSAIQRFGIVM